MINGLGRSRTGPADTELAAITVERGKRYAVFSDYLLYCSDSLLARRYRFRLVSISCDPNFIFSIDGHRMTVIEVDGVNTQSLTVDSIRIFAGQRYSFVVSYVFVMFSYPLLNLCQQLNANQPDDNYWIRALPNIPTGATTQGGKNSAILRYKNAPAEEPKTIETPSIFPLNETDLRPFVPTPVVCLVLLLITIS